MILMSLLAVFNGILIGLARSLNGRLTISNGAFSASTWNHFVGFCFLTLILLVLSPEPFVWGAIPKVYLLGGVVGALYVSISSHVVPRLGITVVTVLVISGQLVTSLILDIYNDVLVLDHLVKVLQVGSGVCFLVLGVYLSYSKE